MKKLILFAAMFICIASKSQETDCVAECSKRKIFKTGNVAYYQNSKMQAYDIKHLKIDLTIQPGSRTISKGSAAYKVVTKQLLDSFVIEFKGNMLLDSVYVNNTKRSFTRNSDHVYIAFSPSIAAGTTLDLVFYYNGTVSTKAFFSGTNSSGLTYTASVSESYQAREWFPAKQLLNDKIDSLDMWITTTAGNLAGSNGVLKSVVDLPGNMKQFKWKSNYKINYYLPMIAVGNYMDYRNYAKPAAMSPDSILIQHFIVNNPSYFNTNKPQLDKTPPMVEKQSELYGLYPFLNEKYGHAQAEIGGGMEHQTMSTMANFNTSLIAHELGHQWFGDYVTCASWQDIWVNEGFARYTEYLMVEKLPSLYTTSTPASVMQSFHANVMTQPGGSVYVPSADLYNEARIFSLRLSYDKGAAIVHNLRFEMQDDTLFFKTLKTFLNQYKDTFATGENLKTVAEGVCGRSFTDFFNQWYYGQGYPTISVNATRQNDSITLVVNQTTSMPSVTPFFKGWLELKITSPQGDTIVKVNQQTNNQSFKFPYKKTPTTIEVDPNNWIINQTGSITVNVVTAISPVNPAAAGVKIYPKPAKKDLFIEMPTATFQQLQIFDIQGRLGHKQNISASASKLNIKLQLAAGTYTLLLTGKKKVVADKIVVL